MAHPEPTHGGTVVYRDGRQGPQFLVIGAKGSSGEWVFPKGHIEPGESPEQAALRELTEETGAVAEIQTELGTTTFDLPKERVVARFYLARFLGMKDADEDRSLAWLPYEIARNRLTFDDTRKLLDRASYALTNGPSGSGPGQ